MENKKINSKRLRNHNKEISPEPVLKAPPPTPCISFKPRSGSVPDVRVAELKKEKSCGSGPNHRTLPQAFSSLCRPPHRSPLDLHGKRSTSEHVMTSEDARGPLAAFGAAPCTSNLLHSVRQRLMNL